VTRAERRRRHDREHRHDREVVAAVWRREQAATGHGFRFEIPESARKPKP
jgi:hypothetical protein